MKIILLDIRRKVRRSVIGGRVYHENAHIRLRLSKIDPQIMQIRTSLQPILVDLSFLESAQNSLTMHIDYI